MTGHSFAVAAAVYCHIGGNRSNNEDNYYLNGIWKKLEFQNCNCRQVCSAVQPALFAVCDGMGGQQHGEVASLLAVSWLHQYRADFLSGPQPKADGTGRLVRMSQQLWEACQTRGIHMGSTVVAAALREDSAYLYGLGDSRAYLMDETGLQQLTQDHTMAAEAEYIGLTGGRSLPATDPRSHQLTQYFGMDCREYDPTPCCCRVPLRMGQRFLLCSDGLSDSLSPQLLGMALGYSTPADSARALVATALEQGAADNITAIVLEIV